MGNLEKNIINKLNELRIVESRKFQYTCVDLHGDYDRIEELEYIIDNSKEISYDLFLKNVNKNQFKNLVSKIGSYAPLDDFSGKRKPHIKNDWSVKFYASKLPNGRPAYYMDWSSIEHVFY